MSIDKKFLIRCRAVIINDDKLLVVRIMDNKFYALPGGHLEWGEDIKECLSREIVEELGIKPEIGRLLYINNFIEKENEQSIEFFFEVTNGKDYLDIHNLTRSHAHEISEMLWVSQTDNIKILPKKLAEDFKAGNILSDTTRFMKDF